MFPPMLNTHNQHRLFAPAHILIAALLLTLFPTTLHAQEAEATYTLRPHCDVVQNEEDWLFGEIPTAGFIADTGDGRCSKFAVENPETLKTNPLSVGDILDMDLIIENPNEDTIERARAWLTYDPNVLEGVTIEMFEVEPYFIATPGESDFDSENGYAMMELSSETLDEPADAFIMFARIQFRVLKATPTGTVIGFHDVQPGGHTTIVARDTSEIGTNILADDPGSLHVVMNTQGNAEESSSSSQASAPVFPPVFPSSSSSSSSSMSLSPAISSFNFNPPPASSLSSSSRAVTGNEQFCNTHADCTGGDMCIAGVCQDDPNKAANGSSCTQNVECASNLCSGGICIPSTAVQSSDNSRTAFALLQVQNLRVTTEGTSIFLAWDELKSSQLKAYNVYYGTTSGRYIQLRTVPSSSRSLTLRTLPVGTTYYLAIRAVSVTDEESAFSTEVAVTVGDPGSSTSPLDLRTLAGIDTNPIAGNLNGNAVPGETGLPTVLMIALLISGIAGTLFASRRQLAIHSES